MSEKSTKTMDTPSSTSPQTKSTRPRFVASGLDVEGYVGTRVRQWSPWQRKAVATKVKAIREKLSGEKATLALAQVLQTCLVKPERPKGAARLARRGASGPARLVADLKPAQIEDAVNKCLEASGIDA